MQRVALIAFAAALAALATARLEDLQIRNAASSKFAVVFDAGSTGTRVHVFAFDQSMQFLPLGDGFELYRKVEPGLSSYATQPKAAAESLRPLLDAALAVIPVNVRAQTPVRLGATAGLRLLPGSQSDDILLEVKKFLSNSTLKYDTSSVTVLDGYFEGAYEWITANYMLNRLGKTKDFSQTVGVIDLGGGSVQLAYGISLEVARRASNSYVQKLRLLGGTYYLYAHSYLHYGAEAARAEMLKLVDKREGCPCLLAGFHGEYTYNSETFEAKTTKQGANVNQCIKLVDRILEINNTCGFLRCDFNGIWNGGGGPGRKKLYLSTNFYYRSRELKVINEPLADIIPLSLLKAAKTVCSLRFEDVSIVYPKVRKQDLAYVCMDIIYQYRLLVKGYGVPPTRTVTVVNSFPYKSKEIDASWPLGLALEAISETSLFTKAIL